MFYDLFYLLNFAYWCQLSDDVGVV